MVTTKTIRLDDDGKVKFGSSKNQTIHHINARALKAAGPYTSFVSIMIMQFKLMWLTWLLRNL